MGSYIGGIATLFAVFITIWDNNRKLEKQKQIEKENELEQRKLLIKPYLDTRYIFFDQDAEMEENDRIFDIEETSVKKMRYNFTPTDKHLIEVRQSVAEFVYLRCILRNIGLGSAVNIDIIINGFPAKMAIAKEEKVNLYFLIDMKKLDEAVFDIELDYWDTDHKAHYYQKDCLVVNIDGDWRRFKLREQICPMEQ